ncbi:MAG: alpha/beta hydrolase [Alistipes sp.]|nr:alpha/beta hydrolase [Candidatus Alistipes equi]
MRAFVKGLVLIAACSMAWVCTAQYKESHPEFQANSSLKPSFTVLLYPKGQSVDEGIVENGQQITLGPSQDNELRGEETMTALGKRSNIGNDARMDFYFPKKHNGQLVICCPGGGYKNLSIFNCGVYEAEWLVNEGCVACVLKYRMPMGHHTIPLRDVQNALRYCRYHAKQWGVNQIGVMGDSAGGHLAASASTMYVDKDTRPDFAVLLYPRITLKRGGEKVSTKYCLLKPDSCWDNNIEEHERLIKYYSPNTHVTTDTPSTIIFLSADDKLVPATNMIPYYTKLIENKVRAELHVYPEGGHGWGFGGERYKGKGKDKFIKYRQEFYSNLSRWLKEQRNK